MSVSDQTNKETTSDQVLAAQHKLLDACFNGDAELAKRAIHNGANVHIQMKDGWTVLMLACQNGHLQCAELLLKHEVNMDIQKQNGWHALMFACQNGHLQCAELLLKHGVNVDCQNQNGFNALMAACQNGHAECVELLLKHGVNVDCQDKNGWTALMAACQNGHAECVELLLKHGVNVDCQEHEGCTAMMLACQEGQSLCAELLLKHGVNVEMYTKDGFTALMFACQNGYSQCVELLLKHGVNVDSQNRNGWGALMFACRLGRVQCVKLLIESVRATNTINAICEDGMTAVNRACCQGSAEILHLLLDAKADMYIGEYCASDALLHYSYSSDMNSKPGMKPIRYVSSYERDLAGFVLMCGGFDLSRAQRSVGHLRQDYHRAHALLEERQCELLSVLDTDVVVDTRLHRKENGLYHEPLEQVLAYSGMLLKPQVLNIHEDDKKNSAGRVMLTGNYEATKMAFDRHFTHMCCVCRKTSAETMKTCSCRCVRYCSTQCQKQDWSDRHKKEHKNIMEERKRNDA